jgi:hypothetical protein
MLGLIQNYVVLRAKPESPLPPPTHFPRISLEYVLAGHRWLTPVVLATQEAEIRRIGVLRPYLFFFIVVLDGGYIVAFTKVLTIYQI